MAMWYCTCLPFLSEECEKDPYARGGRILRSFTSVVNDLQDFEDTLLDYCANDGLLTMLILWGVATQVDDSQGHTCSNYYWRSNDFVATALEQMREYLQHPIWSAKKLVADSEIPITGGQRERILNIVHRASDKFEDYCKKKADDLNIS